MHTSCKNVPGSTRTMTVRVVWTFACMPSLTMKLTKSSSVFPYRAIDSCSAINSREIGFEVSQVAIQVRSLVYRIDHS